MRTADVCPTCATYVNALCVIFDGPLLETLDIHPLDSVDAALLKIEAWASSLAVEANISDEVYGPSWDGDLGAASKNALYDKIETLLGGGGPTYESIIESGTQVGNDLDFKLGPTGAPIFHYDQDGVNAPLIVGPANNTLTLDDGTSGWLAHNTVGIYKFDNSTQSNVTANIDFSGLTAARTVLVQDSSGTLAYLSDIPNTIADADDTPYGVSWDGNQEAATKNVIYDKIESLSAASLFNLITENYTDADNYDFTITDWLFYDKAGPGDDINGYIGQGATRILFDNAFGTQTTTINSGAVNGTLTANGNTGYLIWDGANGIYTDNFLKIENDSGDDSVATLAVGNILGGNKTLNIPNVSATLVASVNGVSADTLGDVALTSDDIPDDGATFHSFVTPADLGPISNLPANTVSEIASINATKADKTEVILTDGTTVFTPSLDNHPVNVAFLNATITALENAGWTFNEIQTGDAPEYTTVASDFDDLVLLHVTSDSDIDIKVDTQANLGLGQNGTLAILRDADATGKVTLTYEAGVVGPTLEIIEANDGMSIVRNGADNWEALRKPNALPSSQDIVFNMVAHGFTMLGTNTNIPIPAQIDDATNLPVVADASAIANEAFGFIEVIDVDNVRYITKPGSYVATTHLLDPGDIFYLTDAGGIADNTGSSTNLQKVLEVIDADTLNLKLSEMTDNSVVSAYALTTDPLSQFASTTLAQLNGVISDATLVGDTHTHVIADITDITGTPDGSKFLRDDGVWTAVGGGGDALTANPLSQFAATTLSQVNTVFSDFQLLDMEEVFTFSGTRLGSNIAWGLGDFDLSGNGTRFLGSDATGITDLIGIGRFNVDVPTILAPSMSNANIDGATVDCLITKDWFNTNIPDVVDDTTPQLGGELDTNGNSIGGDSQTATGDGSTTILWANGNTFDFQFGAFNETFTFTNPTKPGTFILKLVQDSVGSRTATWPASVKWPGGSAPTLTTTATTGTDIITFYFDGTDYFAVSTLDFS